MGNLMFPEEPQQEDVSMEAEDAISSVLAATESEQDTIDALFLNHLAAKTFEDNAHFWHDLETGEPISVTPERIMMKLMQIVGELSEAAEGIRKGLPDAHLPHRPMYEVEMADAALRFFDLCAATDIDLGGALVEKRAYNRIRADHKKEAMLADGGKKF